MATEPEYNEARFDPQPPSRKKGMSSGMKVILILLCVGGGFMVLCCGGCVYIGWKFKEGISDDPAVVAEVTKEIAEIEIPPAFTPRGSFKMDFPFIPKVRVAMYATNQDRGMLTLMEVVDPNADPDEFGEAQEQQLQQQMKQQGHDARDLIIEESKDRQFDIRGRKVAVRFAKGVDPKTKSKFRQITASFKGKRENSVAILQMQISEEIYKEDEIVKMLNSIK